MWLLIHLDLLDTVKSLLPLKNYLMMASRTSIFSLIVIPTYQPDITERTFSNFQNGNINLKTTAPEIKSVTPENLQFSSELASRILASPLSYMDHIFEKNFNFHYLDLIDTEYVQDSQILTESIHCDANDQNAFGKKFTLFRVRF